MFDFYKALKKYLEMNVQLFAPIALNGLQATPESITITGMPTSAGERRYDRTKQRNNMFQIMTKSKSQQTAMDTLEMIAEMLENGMFTINGYYLTNCEVYSEPAYLETTEKNEYIFTAAFKAEIEKER